MLSLLLPLYLWLVSLWSPEQKPVVPPRQQPTAQRAATYRSTARGPSAPAAFGDSTVWDEVQVLWSWKYAPADSDSTARARNLRYRWRDSRFDASRRGTTESPLFLDNPGNVTVTYELAPDGSGYYVYERVGTYDIRAPSFITREEYQRRQAAAQQRQYFRDQALRASVGPEGNRLVPELTINSALFRDIFGSGRVSITPNVTVLLDLSSRTNRLRNPSLSIRQQKNTFFDFVQQIQLNVDGKIGEKLKLRANYDTESTFSFENQFKVEYTGLEDDVIKTIEAGNVSLPLGGSLIQGGQNLWGIKLGMQFGPVNVAMVASQQRGITNEIILRGSSSTEQSTRSTAEYDENRHFFLSHYFRSLYEQSLSTLPLVNSPINVTRVEVYVTNRSAASTTNNRNALGLIDLAENDTTNGGVLYNPAQVSLAGGSADNFPDNSANSLYGEASSLSGVRDRSTAVGTLVGAGFADGDDFQYLSNMRRLTETEYTLEPRLGYISLNNRLQQNDVLFVAFEYTIAQQNTPQGTPRVFRVGEFSNDVPSNTENTNVLLLKMLRPNSQRPGTETDPYPTWDLMMKNIYNLGGFNLDPATFRLEVVYQAVDGSGDINYLPGTNLSQRPLLQVFNLDRLRNNSESGADGAYDFIPGYTVLPDRGQIMFPVLEPFGDHLASQLSTDSARAVFPYPELYRQTQVNATQNAPEKNRFRFRGSFAGSAGASVTGGTVVNLNSVQVVPGSVRVTAGSRVLSLGTDYTVDYNVGVVTLLNPAILSSGQDVRITFESNQLFGIQQQTLIGTRFDIKASKNLQLGATFLYFNERPLINKVVIGSEPMSNVQWGIDATWNTQSRALTNWLNALPFYRSQVPSKISFQGEFAQLLPGAPRQISTGTERGIAYLDDFEGAQTSIDLASNVQAWRLASYPSAFTPIATDTTGRSAGYTRANLAWYIIDPRFYDQPQQFGLDNQSPALNIDASRRVTVNEVFPNRTVVGTDLLATLDLQYQPTARGPYNYVTAPDSVNPDGTLRNPQAKWAGIMRQTTGATDFEAANFEFIEFWLLDPFEGNPAAPGGELYFNLGRISEDVLPDREFAFENGMPTTAEATATGLNLRTTPWGRVPIAQVPTNAFDNDPDARPFQDVGLDGLRSVDEQDFFGPFLSDLLTVVTDPTAADAISADPSTDDFRFFTNYPSGTDILTRYRAYNGTENNSPVGTTGQFVEAATLQPDVEDINQDGTFNSQEAYWEYRVPIRPTDLVPGNGFVIDRRQVTFDRPNGTTGQSNWYLFRVPIRTGGRAVGSIQDFTAIDFVRMYLTDFEAPVTLRFGSLKLVSTIWRRYLSGITATGADASPLTEFELGTLNIEENADKQPFNYTIPPDIERQGLPGSPVPGQLLNEQSIVLRGRGVQDGEGQAAFRNYALDLRFYQRIKLWLHAEGLDGLGSGFDQRGDAEAFLRIGSDFVSNYYEVRIPLTPSTPGDQSPRNIWLAENQIDIALADLNLAKERRNVAGASVTQPFTIDLGDGRTLTVVGNPQLNNVRTLMIGMLNPDDGQGPINLELWANELRVTDFDQTSGWAATGRLNIQLADLGSVSLAGAHSTPGYGTVDTKIGDRTTETNTRYDIALNLNVGKLLPEAARLDIPFYGTYSEQRITPKFTPTDPDVLLDTRLEAAPNRQEALSRAEDYTRSYSYAFTNVRKLRGPEAKVDIWDVENFAFTYSFSERFRRTAQIEKQLDQTYLAGIAWNYGFNPKNYEPFKGKPKTDSTGRTVTPRPNALRAFNFYLLPQNLALTIDGNRRYFEEQLREQNPNNLPIQPTFVQDFTISRTLNLRWDLSKSLGFTFTTTTRSRVDEPVGPLDGAKRDTLWRRVFTIGRDTANGYYNLINIGRALNYTQQLNATYQVPFAQSKATDWLSGSVGYTGGYAWQTAALQNSFLGNTISNSRAWNLTGQANLEQLYQKSPWLARQLKPIPRRTIFSEADSSRQEGDEARIARQRVQKGLVGTLFGLKQVDVTYTQSQTTALPGYLPRPANFGLDFQFENPQGGSSGGPAPGWDFVFGYQPDLFQRSGWLQNAANRGWLTRDTALVQPLQQTQNTTLQLRALFKPLRGLEIALDFAQSEAFTDGALFAFNSTDNDYLLSNRQGSSTYSTSTISIGSAFDPIQGSGGAFAAFSANRLALSDRLRTENRDYNQLTNPVQLSSGFWNGYTGTSQDVLVASFLTAYGPYDPGKVPLSGRPAFPLPNWTVSYRGLADTRALREIFQSITITHSYKSLYTENRILNLNAIDLSGDGLPDTFIPLDTSGALPIYNLQPQNVIQQVILTETFSPLLGINLVWKSGLSVLLDFKRSRIVTLNVGALQLTETQNTELTTSVSIKRDRLSGGNGLLGSLLNLPNSVVYRLEGTFRNTRNQNRRLESALPPEPTGGNLSYTIKPSIDYTVSTQLTARVYYEHTTNLPVLSNSFPNSFTAIGVQLRLTLGAARRNQTPVRGTTPLTQPPARGF